MDLTRFEEITKGRYETLMGRDLSERFFGVFMQKITLEIIAVSTDVTCTHVALVKTLDEHQYEPNEAQSAPGVERYFKLSSVEEIQGIICACATTMEFQEV